MAPKATHIYIDINTTYLLSISNGFASIAISLTNSISSQTISPPKIQIRQSFNENKTEGPGNHVWVMYKVKALKSRHQPSDPNFNCTEYTTSFNYTECVRQELVADYKKILNCTPPLLAPNNSEVCNGQINRFKEVSDDRITKPFWKNNYDFESSSCQTPCSQIEYEAEMKHRTKNDKPFASISLSIRVS